MHAQLWTIHPWITECGQTGIYKRKVPPIHLTLDITRTLVSLGDTRGDNCHFLL